MTRPGFQSNLALDVQIKRDNGPWSMGIHAEADVARIITPQVKHRLRLACKHQVPGFTEEAHPHPRATLWLFVAYLDAAAVERQVKIEPRRGRIQHGSAFQNGR